MTTAEIQELAREGIELEEQVRDFLVRACDVPYVKDASNVDEFLRREAGTDVCWAVTSMAGRIKAALGGREPAPLFRNLEPRKKVKT